jgi:hypothetical protein
MNYLNIIMNPFSKLPKNMLRQLVVRPIHIPQLFRTTYPNLTVGASFDMSNFFDRDAPKAMIPQDGQVIDFPLPIPLKQLQSRGYINSHIRNDGKDVVYTVMGFDRTYEVSRGKLDVMLICVDSEVPRPRYWKYPMFTFQIYPTKLVRNILRTNYSDARDKADLAPHWHQYIKDSEEILDSWDVFDVKNKLR